MVHGRGRMLIVILMQYSHSFVSRTIRVFAAEKWQRKRAIRNRFIYTPLQTHTHTHVRKHTQARRRTRPAWSLSEKTLASSHSGRISVSKAHCFDSGRMGSRRAVCRLINHLAADDLCREWPYHDKVREPCTFNYRSEASASTSACSIHHCRYWSSGWQCVCTCTRGLHVNLCATAPECRRRQRAPVSLWWAP